MATVTNQPFQRQKSRSLIMKNKLKKILLLNKTTTLLLHLCVISKRSLSILLAAWSDLDGKLVVVVVEVVVVIIIFLQQSTVLPCAMRYTKTRERDFFPRSSQSSFSFPSCCRSLASVAYFSCKYLLK